MKLLQSNASSRPETSPYLTATFHTDSYPQYSTIRYSKFLVAFAYCCRGGSAKHFLADFVGTRTPPVPYRRSREQARQTTCPKPPPDRTAQHRHRQRPFRPPIECPIILICLLQLCAEGGLPRPNASSQQTTEHLSRGLLLHPLVTSVNR